MLNTIVSVVKNKWFLAAVGAAATGVVGTVVYKKWFQKADKKDEAPATPAPAAQPTAPVAAAPVAAAPSAMAQSNAKLEQEINDKAVLLVQLAHRWAELNKEVAAKENQLEAAKAQVEAKAKVVKMDVAAV